MKYEDDESSDNSPAEYPPLVVHDVQDAKNRGYISFVLVGFAITAYISEAILVLTKGNEMQLSRFQAFTEMLVWGIVTGLLGYFLNRKK